MDVDYIGDPALKPVTSLESVVLVRILFRISNMINNSDTYKQLNWPKVNLRIFAAYPTHLFIALISLLIWFIMAIFF
jgi:hypothetical protein